MHYQIAETPEMTGPQFQAKAQAVKKLIAQRKTHQAAASTRKPLFVQRHVLERELAELKAKPGGQRQASAELDRLKAENMTLKAKIAATSKPAPAKPAAPSALSPRDQRRAAAKSTIADQSDSQLQFVASHRSATDADRSAARAELQARGWTCHANGNFSMSTTKKSRR